VLYTDSNSASVLSLPRSFVIIFFLYRQCTSLLLYESETAASSINYASVPVSMVNSSTVRIICSMLVRGGTDCVARCSCFQLTRSCTVEVATVTLVNTV